MFRRTAAVAVLVCCVVLQLNAAVPFVQIGMDEKPVVDGEMKEQAWQSCARIFPFYENMGTGIANEQTQVRVYYDSDALYAFFTCDEPEPEKLVVDHTERDKDVWRDDCVEIFMQKPGDISIYHVLINSKGVTSDSRFKNAGWDPQLDLKTFVNPDKKQWGVEVAIPWTDLDGAPKEGDVWNINFTRQRKVEFERSAWNATYGTFTNATRFGQIRFARKPVIQKELQVNAPVPGYNTAKVLLDVPGNESAKLCGQDGKPVEMKAGAKRPLALEYPLGLKDTEIVLNAEMDGKIVWRSVFPADLGDTPALEKLQNVYALLKEIPGQLNNGALKSKLEAGLEKALASKESLETAIESSMKSRKAMPLTQYQELNDKVKSAIADLDDKQWVLWQKNNWDDLGQAEFPADFGDVESIQLKSLVNDIEQSNVIISNLTAKPMRLRVSCTDYEWVQNDSTRVKFFGITPELFVADWQDLVTDTTMADPLLPLGVSSRLDIPVGESRQVWMRFPALDLPPGKYQCQLSCTPIGSHELGGPAVAKTVAIELEVDPLRLSTSPDFAVYNWDYASEDAYARDLYEHKVNRFLVTTSIPIPEFDDSGNALNEIDYSAYDRLLRIKMKYAEKSGGEILFSYGLLESFNTAIQKELKFEYRSDAWDQAFRYTYGHWLAHLKELGLDYDDYSVQVWDEALMEELDYTIEGCKLMREIDPNVRLVMDGTQKYNDIKRLEPWIDVWIPDLGFLQNYKNSKEILALYKSMDEPIYGYTCATRMKSQSAYDYYLLKPWRAAMLDLDGVCYWAYNSWRGDPWNDYDGPLSGGTFYADCGAIYNGNHAPVTSRRWEAWREGIEQWQIIRLLQRCLANDKSALAEISHEITRVAENGGDLGLSRQVTDGFVEQALELGEKSLLEIVAAKGEQSAQVLTVDVKSNRESHAVVWYRLLGTDDWQRVEMSDEAKQHHTEIALPPASTADWMVVAWDAQGRVAWSEGD